MTSYTKLCFELLATIRLSYVQLYNASFRAPPRQVWTVLLSRSEPCIRRLSSRSEPCIRRLTSRSRRLTSRSKPCESRSARRVVQAVASQEPTEHGIPLVSFPTEFSHQRLLHTRHYILDVGASGYTHMKYHSFSFTISRCVWARVRSRRPVRAH